MKLFCSVLLFSTAVVSNSFTTAFNDSCQSRCGAGFDTAFPCQCNTKCLNYNDCCTDYTATCIYGGDATVDGRACKRFAQVMEELWANDTDRLDARDVTLNYQAQLPAHGTILDESPDKFFSYVNESRLSSPVYTSFLPLLDNYNPVKNVAENVTDEKIAEQNHFLDVLLDTAIWQSVYDYLKCEGKIQDMSDLRTLFKRLWFDLYPRSGKSTILDSSGFEHVMVGEYKSSGTVNGLHSWLAFYEKEKMATEPNINYYGHTCDVHPHTACTAYDWDGRKKRLSSFFLNSSPAYDLAMYSLCYVMQRGTCHVVVDGQVKTIQTYSKEGHIATAFVVA